MTGRARRLAAFDSHERVYELKDVANGLQGFIAIHNRNLGPALGGCRMWPYESTDAALVDVLRLSRGMTYKAALAGLDFGGGKAVIIGDPRSDKTEALFRAFGKMVESLEGAFLTAEDVGINVTDMDWVARETAYAFGTSEKGGSPSEMTALGVVEALKAAAKNRFGAADLSDFTIAVQGLGNVGLPLCRLLAGEGAKLVVADIDRNRVARVIHEVGAMAVSPGGIHRVPAEAFVPCALGAILNRNTIPEMTVAIVAGSANNQLETNKDSLALHRRGILYAPDCVANAGGLIRIVVGQVEGEADPAKVAARVHRIGSTLGHIFHRADQEDLPPCVLADRLAEERIYGTPKTSDVRLAG